MNMPTYNEKTQYSLHSYIEKRITQKYELYKNAR